jgi:hypothetical protein
MLADRHLLIGAPDAVAERLAQFGAAGVDTLLIQIVADSAEHRSRIVETFASRVLQTRLDLLDKKGDDGGSNRHRAGGKLPSVARCVKRWAVPPPCFGPDYWQQQVNDGGNCAFRSCYRALPLQYFRRR